MGRGEEDPEAPSPSTPLGSLSALSWIPGPGVRVPAQESSGRFEQFDLLRALGPYECDLRGLSGSYRHCRREFRRELDGK
jgi:hypothetical protein